ncbi:efflux transporter outer membrane subunit [Helicobacter cappadocius]|uniref:Efflux transporter outer membrane subunit n=1 Tax=Helicobacter cappadocius TaxID=3063998 RepID=A0AA90PXI3_9HELI|nr:MULTISPECIES: efflux transporter outer membrane subunit [unclassified Helicobacter]MDO7252516.1 efflux transporter outer membrane subunit [Helicobacter sp. faydin-H75]MDP2538383.1 efflux transporter outer membrane subunit [Helicobacter sp. faydin-H76]
MRWSNAFYIASFGILFIGCVPKISELPKDSKITLALEETSEQQVQKNWWKNFNDPNLIFILQKAREYNSDLQIAQTRIQQAMGILKIAKSTLYPSVNITMSPQYTQNMLTPVFGFSTPIGMIDPTLNISYDFDFFGKNKKERKNKAYQAQAIIAQSIATKISLDASVAKTYINLIALKDKLSILQNTLKARAIELDIAQSKSKTGYSSQYDEQQAKIQYEATKAQIAPTKLSIEKTQNTLEELTGINAKELKTLKSLNQINEPILPKKIPSSILRNRPDIAYAEFELAASSEALAKARANFLPDFNLIANLGVAAFTDFFDTAGHIFTGAIGASILAPLFQGGKLKGEFAVANAKRDEAAYTYKKIVLNAYKEVKNAQASIEWLKDQQLSLQEEHKAALKTLQYAKGRYKDGYSSYLEVVDAERSLLDLEGQIITLKTAYIESLINLYQSLGSGFNIEEVKLPKEGKKEKKNAK